MDEVKRKVKLNNKLITQQTVRKLYHILCKKPSEVEVCQSEECKFLLDSCSSEDAILSQCCCETLLQLVKNDKLNYSFLLKALLNFVPNAKDLNGIIKGVSGLLCLQILVMKKEQGKYSNPFSIRTPPHPFITILMNRSESWMLMYQEVYSLLNSPDETIQECIIEMLEPFLKFVFIEPSTSSHLSRLRTALLNVCTNAKPGQNIEKTDSDLLKTVTIANSNCDKLLILVINIIPHMQRNAVFSANDMSLLLNGLYLKHSNSKTKPISEELRKLMKYVLEVVYSCFEENVACINLIDSVLQLLQTQPDILCVNPLLLEFVDILNVCSGKDHYGILSCIAKHIEMLSSRVTVNSNEMLILNMLYWPLINIITFTDTVFDCFAKDNQKISFQILDNLSKVNCNQLQKQSSLMQVNQGEVPFGIKGYESSFILNLTNILYSDEALKNWLLHLNQLLDNNSLNIKYMWSSKVVSMIVGVFCSQTSSEILTASLNLLIKFAEMKPGESLSVLSVLLYKLNHVESPMTKLQILNALPCISTDKVSVIPVLKSLQLLSGSQELKALSIKLITHLWKYHDRCFPYLLQMLLEKESFDIEDTTKGNVVILSKAKSIKLICQLMPHQHGEDLVKPISHIINHYGKICDAPAVYLALEALYYLCEAKVIDIKTVWTALDGKLNADLRPLVIKGICKLFSLVPYLTVENPSYEEFAENVLKALWQYSNGDMHTNNSETVNAAFDALSNFKTESYQWMHLPSEVQQYMNDFYSKEAENEDENTSFPFLGECFIVLLKQLEVSEVHGFTAFLASNLQWEIKNMPRGISHPSSNVISSKHDTVTLSIPEFLLSRYEQNKLPSLRQGLAASLLFGFDPYLKVGKDGKVKKTYIMQHGKRYTQMLYTMINEFPLDPTDWHRVMLSPIAWTNFMQKCFLACIDSRKAELETVLKGDKTEDSDKQFEKDAAWLWARDMLTDLIKSCQRGSPTSQGNSILALAALLVVSDRYIASLEKDEVQKITEKATAHKGQSHWCSGVIATVISIFDPKYQSDLEVFCQQKIEQERTPAPLLARCGAALSISLLIPTLIVSNTETIFHVLNIFIRYLPCEKSASQEPGVLQFYAGLALGGVLKVLCNERFLEIADEKGWCSFWEALRKLEESAFSNTDTRMGSVLGLGICASALCKDSKPNTKVWLCGLQQKLTSLTQQIEKENTIFEAVCVSLSCLTTSAYAVNLISQEIVDRTVATLYDYTIENPHLTGPSMGLGMICCGLYLANHPTVGSLRDKLFDTWVKQLQNTKALSSMKVAAVHGVIALVGGDYAFIVVNENETVKVSIKMADLVRVMKGNIQSEESGHSVQNCQYWLLAQLYSSIFSAKDLKSSVPSSYHYLPETSVLKASTNFLILAGKNGDFNARHVEIVLECLNKVNQGLPPLNWQNILSPFMRMKCSDAIKDLVISIAIKQSCHSTNAALFITNWMLSPLYDSLSKTTKLLIHESLPQLIKFVVPGKLKLYLNSSFLRFLTDKENDEETVLGVMNKGLLRALKVSDPPQSVMKILFEFLEVLYPLAMSSDLATNAFRVSFCKCLMEIPDVESDRIVENISLTTEGGREISLSGLFIRCYLVGNGCKHVVWLNSALELISTSGNLQECLPLLFQCFFTMDGITNNICNVSSKSQWLLELMGLMNTTLRESKSGNEEGSYEILQSLLYIFSCAVIAWSCCSLKMLLGVPSFHENSSKDQSTMEFSVNTLHLLPPALSSLVLVEPWKQMTPKLIDWLIEMNTLGKEDAMEMKEKWNFVFKSGLLSLRHTKDFQKIQKWSSVV